MSGHEQHDPSIGWRCGAVPLARHKAVAKHGLSDSDNDAEVVVAHPSRDPSDR
jgi:hypothetical protein